MPALTKQTDTNCRVLGVDAHGVEHVHDRERNRIVALNGTGIEVQLNLDDQPGGLADWMAYVAERRGWQVEQWVGHRWARAFANVEHTLREV